MNAQTQRMAGSQGDRKHNLHQTQDFHHMQGVIVKKNRSHNIQDVITHCLISNKCGSFIIHLVLMGK